MSSAKGINFAVVQTPFLVGDIVGNTKKMRAAAMDAKSKGADVVIFPELALIGYPPEDLLLRPSLSERIKIAMANLSEIEGILMIVGYPHVDHHGTFNSAAIIQGGSQKGFYHKQCLPNYGVFDERRYFDKGRNQVLFDYKGVTMGLLICEDIWQDTPIANLKAAGAELIVTINASPFEIDKQLKRKELLAKQALKYGLPIIYANAVGGQDDLVFDGGSMMVNASGEIAQEASRFLGQLLIAPFDITSKQFAQQTKAPLQLSAESEMYQALVVGLRDYVNRSGFGGVIVGLSGGIDSALTLCIATDALGADKVYAVMMPYKYTSDISIEDAEAQAKRLNVSYTVCPIHDAVAGLRSSLAPLFAGNASLGVTEENLQARARGVILMALSNKFGHMVVNTSNKSEVAVGYGTLYGDMVGGFGALKDVYKTDVYRLAAYRNRLEDTPVIPERVILRAPSAELRPDQKDQDSLPDYDTLDAILRLYIEEDLSFKDIVKAGFDEETVAKVLRMVDINEYKRRQAPIGSKIGKRAFGRERRYPLVNAWQIKF
ncbi:MAG: NAD+ synthase [Moraxella sp.]|nr:NAD+ synthase [Moraxella sp.]